MSMKGYDYIAQFMKGYGVSHFFYVEVILRQTIRAAEELGIKGIMTHTENAAGFMADGYARVSGKPGICMAQSIGSANLSSGLMDAWLATTPVLAITGKKLPKFQYRNAYQEGDHRLFYEGLTKFNAEVQESAQLSHLLRQSIRTATTGKPRPVHLDVVGIIGREIEQADIEEELYIEEAFKQYPPFRPAAEEAAVEKAAKLIEEAKKPVIVAGRGAIVSGAHKEIYDLAVKADIPIVTSPDGKTIVNEKDEIWAGIVGNYGMKCANKAVSAADLVIFIGTQTSDQTTLNWNYPKPAVKAIQIDIDASEIGRNYPNTTGLVGDAKTIVAQLLAATKAKRNPEWRKEISEYVNETLASYAEKKGSDSTPIRPERLCYEIEKVLPDNAVLVSDTGWAAVWSAGMIRMKASQKYLRAAGSLGWAFPGALGAKCGAPDRPVICFTGDGGFYYHLSEMETAVKFGINTVTVINNNGILGMCAPSIAKDWSGNEEKGLNIVRFSPINFAEVAKSFGMFGIRVEKPDMIGPAIQQALDCGKPALVEVITDPQAEAPDAVK